MIRRVLVALFFGVIVGGGWALLDAWAELPDLTWIVLATAAALSHYCGQDYAKAKARMIQREGNP